MVSKNNPKGSFSAANVYKSSRLVVSVVVCGAAVVVGWGAGNVGRVMVDKWFGLCWHNEGCSQS